MKSSNVETRKLPECPRGAIATLSVLIGLAAIAAPDVAISGPPPAAQVTVFATGFNNPRGLKFGPDGYLYVAEGGFGGGTLASQVPPDCYVNPLAVGPYSGSPTGSQISRVGSNGSHIPWVVDFPSSQTNDESGKLVSGVADVAFIGDTMYALIGGGGCSHGVPDKPNGVAVVNADRTWTYIADLSEWSLNHPVANPEVGDYEPEGTWYSMIAVRGALYTVEPNHGEVVKVTTSGNVSRVIDISATYGHIVPTTIAYHGNFYVGNLDEFGVPAGSSKIYKITPSGQIKIDTSGFSLVTGLAFDGRGRMYVLEASTDTVPPLLAPGRIVRVDPSGRQQVIVTGLTAPSAMTMGPDGALYVSDFGFGPPPVGLGQIVKVVLTD